MTRLRQALGAGLALLIIAGCGGDTGADAVTKIRVGIKFDQPGIGLMEDGHPTGIDVDMAAYVAWKLGYSPYEIAWVEAYSAIREQLIVDGEVDMVVATFTIREDLMDQIDFAGPYLVAGQDIMVRADNTDIVSVESLAGKSVCSAAGTSSIRRLEDLLGDSATVIGRERHSECAAMLISGEVDAISTDDIILAGFAATDEYFGKVRLVGAPFSEEPLGVAIPQGSREMCERVNAAIAEMIADGSWAKFVDRHTGGTGWVPNATLNPPSQMDCADTSDEPSY